MENNINQILEAMNLSSKQKALVAPFCISLPAVYMMLSVYWVGFSNLPFYDKLIFAAAATVAAMLSCKFILLAGRKKGESSDSLDITVWFCYIVMVHCLTTSIFGVCTILDIIFIIVMLWAVLLFRNPIVYLITHFLSILALAGNKLILSPLYQFTKHINNHWYKNNDESEIIDDKTSN